jgi:hypothetical protein
MACCNQNYNYSNNNNNKYVSIPIRETVFTYSGTGNCGRSPILVNGLNTLGHAEPSGESWGADMEGPPLQITGSGLSITSVYCSPHSSSKNGNTYAVVAGTIVGCPSCITATVYVNNYDTSSTTGYGTLNGAIGVLRLQCCGSCVMGSATLNGCPGSASSNAGGIPGQVGTVTVQGTCYCNCGIRTICITTINVHFTNTLT